MTRKEAISSLYTHKDAQNENVIKEAYDIAIRSLEAWEKVIDEIGDMYIEYGFVAEDFEVGYNRGISDALLSIGKNLNYIES